MAPAVHIGPGLMAGQAHGDALARLAQTPDGQRQIPLKNRVILKDGGQFHIAKGKILIRIRRLPANHANERKSNQEDRNCRPAQKLFLNPEVENACYSRIFA
jgi:hypothetical protein